MEIPLERRRLRWEYNIKMDLKEIEYEEVDWIQLARDTVQWLILVNTNFYL
jgi:hypothetical protein